MSKIDFLKNEFLLKLKSINPDEKSRWGLMSVQQMIEHMSDAFRQAYSTTLSAIVTPVEHLERAKTFMMSEKPFKENTKNVLLPSIPVPVKHVSFESSLVDLEKEISGFFNFFEKEPEKIITNPIFGHLNFEEWVHLLNKHAIHHLNQFGIKN